MSTPTDSRREHPSTYFVQDRSNEEELVRLQVQDQMVTAGMGGVLPEQLNPTIFQRALDVGCGTGGWLIEVAKTYPTTSLLLGVDANERMIAYACAQAEAQQVSDRVQFRTTGALRMLEFPVDFFDLQQGAEILSHVTGRMLAFCSQGDGSILWHIAVVNQRFGSSFLRTWDWPKLLQEYQRVTRPGGVIRLTESDTGKNNSPALTRLYQLLEQTSYKAGHLFTPGKNGPANELANLLRKSGFQNVQSRSHTFEYRAGSAEWQLFYEDTRRVFRTIVPFFRKWTRLPDDYETIYQQALSEMQQPDFVATWNLLTAWATKRHSVSVR